MIHYSIFFQTLWEGPYSWWQRSNMVNEEIKCKIKEQEISAIFKKWGKITDFEIEDKELAERSELTQNQEEKYFHWNWITHKPAIERIGL